MKPGTQVGRYRIVGRIGEGGIGAVFQALDTRLGRRVALKFLHARLVEDPVARSRFRREAMIAASFSHPALCPVYDFVDEHGVPYIVMELLSGRALSERLREGYLPTETIVDVGKQLGGALIEVHRQGIVHRDIKPANVMLCADGVARLLDFGVAKSREALAHGTLSPAPPTERAPSASGAPTGSTTSSGAEVVGTVSYMSPEQVRGAALDERSDLFSLGVLLYEMAAGVRPFDGASPAAVFDQILHVEPPSPRCLHPGLPDGLLRVVRKALRKTPDSRYRSADELVSDLSDVRPDAPAVLPHSLAAAAHGQSALLVRSA